MVEECKMIYEIVKYSGTVLISNKTPATPYEILLLHNKSTNDTTPGDLVIIEKTENPQELKLLAEIESTKIYTLFEKQSAAILKEFRNIPRIPAQEESYTVYKAKIVRIMQSNRILEPGIPPSPGMKWRKPSKKEVETFLRTNFTGLPVALAKSTCDIQKDINNEVILIRHPDILPFFIELIAGQPGSGKTVTIGTFAWYYTQQYKDPETKQPAAFICINNKSIDLLYLDYPAPYIDPLWKDMEIQPEGIKDFQIIYPSIDGSSRNSGCRQIPFTFDSLLIQPEALLGIVDLTDKAQLQLPDIFRYWQEQNINGSSTHFEDFLDYLRNNGQSAGYNRVVFPAKSKNGRIYNIPIHESTLMATIANLAAITDYFDDENATMINAQDIVVPGRCTVIDVSRDPTGKFQNLIIRQLLLSILEYQKRTREKGKPICPVIFAIDEAHLIYSSKHGDVVTKEISTIAKTGRTLKCGLILASQLISDLSSDILRIAGSKIIFRTQQKEAQALGLNNKAHVLGNLQPGFALFQDNVKIGKQLFIKIPMAPCNVRGE